MCLMVCFLSSFNPSTRQQFQFGTFLPDFLSSEFPQMLSSPALIVGMCVRMHYNSILEHLILLESWNLSLALNTLLLLPSRTWTFWNLPYSFGFLFSSFRRGRKSPNFLLTFPSTLVRTFSILVEHVVYSEVLEIL